jgi:hypothetical protein
MGTLADAVETLTRLLGPEPDQVRIVFQSVKSQMSNCAKECD